MIIDKINIKLIEEQVSNCTMFWLVPMPSDNDFEWGIQSFNANGDDLSNWLVILHKLKHIWGKNFDPCKDFHSSLPRGIICNGVLYHGNNMPKSIDLRDLASELGYKLGKDLIPKYHKNFGIKQNELECLQNILGKDLGLEYTE
jgi:hypothetical protein